MCCTRTTFLYYYWKVNLFDWMPKKQKYIQHPPHKLVYAELIKKIWKEIGIVVDEKMFLFKSFNIA